MSKWISSRYSTGATVAPSGSADYDDVVRCARKVEGKCKIRLKGLLKKKGPGLGPPSKAKVKAGKSKRITLKVKPKHLPKLVNSKRVFVKQKVKAQDEASKKVVRKKLRHA